MATGFYWDEKCFWHAGGNYALTLPLGDFVQPLAAGGLPENPETKRRLKNLIEVSGLIGDMQMRHAPAATWEDLARVHPETYLTAFRELSDAGGGELGLRTPFARGGFEIAAHERVRVLSAGFRTEARAPLVNTELLNVKTASADATARVGAVGCVSGR